MRKLAPRLGIIVWLAAGPGAGGAEQPTFSGPGLGLVEAVRLALEHDPNVTLLESRVAAARGALAVAASPFDPILASTAVQSTSRQPDDPAVRDLVSTLAFTQRLRTGLSLEPELRLTRERQAGAPGAAENTGTVTFRLRQPLLRGRGRLANTAGEEAAGRDLAATGLEVRHELGRRVLSVASQYWSLAAAVRDLEVLRASEASARELLETTRKLIAADEVPAAEEVQLEASLAAQESATIGGERQLFAARQDLGREIGLDAQEIGMLPLPGDPFPQLRAEELPAPAAWEAWLALARRRRADLLAAAERSSGAELRLRAAALALRPKLDLVLAPSYSGRAEGAGLQSYAAPLYRDVPGLSTSLTLDLSWPLFNRRAAGELAQSEAGLRQAEAQRALVEKAVGALVPDALDAVVRDARRLEKAREAVGLFERAVSNEEKKLRAGTSTLINLISQRDRLTSARQVEVRAELSLALSLLQLRFETGTLLAEPAEGGALVDDGSLTTLPAVAGEGGP